MPIATTAEQRAGADSVRSWARNARTVATVRAQETDPGAWRTSWAGLAGSGLFAVALPEARGGAGGSVSDLAVLLEQAAAALVPGPVVTTALAGLLLARADCPAADPLLTELAEGRLPVGIALGGIALSGAEVSGSRGPQGGLTVRGSAPAVLGADSQTALLLSAHVGTEEVWFLLDAGTAAVKVIERAGADFSRALAEIHLDDAAVPADRILVGITTELVHDLAVVLFAAEASGVAGWCLQTAVDYAKAREQFGRPIGSFQAIKHLCAEMLCRVELATAVAWDCARSADDDAQRPLAAAAAGSIALDAAVETAKDCIQVLGGIGFTWEHDAHLFLRRALALRQFAGGSTRWRTRMADLSLAGTRRSLAVELDDDEQLRAGVRAKAEAIATLPADGRRSGLVDAGYLAPHWPAPHGLGAGAAEQVLIDQELTRAGVERPDLVIAGWAVPTILRYGTPAQILRFVEPTLRGEITWCQLFSEPDAGSDLAALRTKAARVEGGWRLSGQKVWTSLAREADWAICLARTDPHAPKHQGISYFLLDMASEGIDIRPLREITGEAVFNEVFLDETFVADELLVGELNDGWRLARSTLVNERIAMGGASSLGDAVERVLTLTAEKGLTKDDGVRERLGALISEGLAGSLLELRSTLRQLNGQDAGAESSVRKLVGVRHRQRVAEAGLDLLGIEGAAEGPQLREFLLTRCLTIAGGTSQVLLTLAGERILGLPRG